jgi:hypothetical protein
MFKKVFRLLMCTIYICIRDSNFLKSVPMEIIKTRCLENSTYMKEALVNFFLHPNILTIDNKVTLFKSGYVEDGAITSYLFLQLLLADSTIVQKKGNDVPETIEDVLFLAIKDMKTDPFTINTSYESSIGKHFAALLSRIPGIYLKPELQFPKSDITEKGPLPCVDFLINGKFNICVELLMNEDKLIEHLDRFQSLSGTYEKFKDQFVLLIFRSEN